MSHDLLATPPTSTVHINPPPHHYYHHHHHTVTLPEHINFKMCLSPMCLHGDVLCEHVYKLLLNFKCLAAIKRLTLLTRPEHIRGIFLQVLQPFHCSVTSGHQYNSPNTSMTPYSWKTVQTVKGVPSMSDVVESQRPPQPNNLRQNPLILPPSFFPTLPQII